MWALKSVFDAYRPAELYKCLRHSNVQKDSSSHLFFNIQLILTTYNICTYLQTYFHKLIDKICAI